MFQDYVLFLMILLFAQKLFESEVQGSISFYVFWICLKNFTAL